MGEYSQCRYVQNVTSGFEVWRTHMPNNENLTLHQTETLSIDTANQVEGIIPFCTSILDIKPH